MIKTKTTSRYLSSSTSAIIDSLISGPKINKLKMKRILEKMTWRK